MSLAYFITHRLIAGNVLELSLFFLVLFAGFLVLPKLRIIVLNPAVSPLLGFLILTTFLFSQPPKIDFWIMILASFVLMFYVTAEIFFVPLNRTQIVIFAALIVLFLILHLPDGSVTYLGLAALFAGLLLTKLIITNRSPKFKVLALVGAITAIFLANYLTRVYYKWQAIKLLRGIGETARFLLQNDYLRK